MASCAPGASCGPECHPREHGQHEQARKATTVSGDFILKRFI